LPGGRRRDLPKSDPLAEGERILTICNACRYCEGYCAVFPAIERRLRFTPADLNYLANLCHNCGECYYACQYAPPHEFAVNVARTLEEIRVQSYRQYAWPRAFSAAFGSWRIAAMILIFSVASWFAAGERVTGAGAQFYRVISHRAMVMVFGAAALLVLAAIVTGVARFWRDSGGGRASVPALKQALIDALKLTYLNTDGQGCTYPGEQRSRARWWFHHLTFYGFVLCFASTCVAAFYHYVLGLRAPYRYLSLPVVLGTIGGIGLLAGPAGLFWLMRLRDAATRAREQDSIGVPFVVLLILTSATGLLLLGLRETPAMSLLLAVHLGVVLALFLTMPYGKFVHGVYRWAALVRYALERSRTKGL
jgi:citrate/tricarballylate utilization protein